jgi:hypothetical protein
MSIVADDSSAFTAGDVSLVGGDTGFAITNMVMQLHTPPHAHHHTNLWIDVTGGRAGH